MAVSFLRLWLVLGLAAAGCHAAPAISAPSEAAPNGTHIMNMTEIAAQEIQEAPMLIPVGTNETLYYPELSMGSTVWPLIDNISVDSLKAYLTRLTSPFNRDATTERGAQSALWIYETLSEIAKEYPESNANVSLLYHHEIIPQPSIIARLPGRDPKAPITVLGSHQDTMHNEVIDGEVAGADDDASGTVNLMEAFRVLVTAGFVPQTPVEFHFYAAEEIGLLGSQFIARDYRRAGVNITGMCQFDMTAYVKPNTTGVIALVPDFTHKDLNSFIGKLVDEYSVLEWIMSTPCKYGCSDHASWNKYGYPSAFPMEGDFETATNPDIHTSNDTINSPGWSWNHITEFTKLAVAFAVEMSSSQ